MEDESESAELFRRLAQHRRLADVDRRHLLDRVTAAELALFGAAGKKAAAARTRAGSSTVVAPAWLN